MIIYHYTSIETLYKIITNKTLWLTNLKNSSDPTEGTLSPEEFEKYVKQTNITKENMNFDELNKHQDIYGLSATKTGDSLLHWSMYGDNFKGVAIGFNIDKFFENLPFLKCENLLYDDAERTSYIKEHYKEESKKAYNKIQKSSVNEMITRQYPECLLLFKNISYKQENEVRLFFDEMRYLLTKSYVESQAKDFADKQNLIKTIKKVESIGLNRKHFAKMRNGINGYFELKLDSIWKDINKIIVEIRLGTYCPQSKTTLIEFLKSENFEMEESRITNSSIPIRKG